LQLFFIISGFFAVNQQKKRFNVFIKNQIRLLVIPFIFFVTINIIYFNLDGTKKVDELVASFASNFTDFSNSVAPELWFLPALFCVSVLYYLLLKLTKSKLIILLFSFTLFLIKKAFSDTFLGFALIPFINLFGLSSVPEYIFFYALGSFVFPYLIKTNKVLENTENSKYKRMYYLAFLISITITLTVYFFKPDMFINKFFELTGINNTFSDVTIRLLLTLIICTTVFFISYTFRASSYLADIGKNTMILLGFEFIIKNFLVLHLIPMFNMGIVTLDSTVQVMSISLLMVICVKSLFKPLNKHIPFLLGRRN
jgi:fucose 4-O-acetylase-like acetyltransferase